MVEVNMTLLNRAHHKVKRMTLEGFGQMAASGQVSDLRLPIAPLVRARHHIHTAVIRFGIIQSNPGRDLRILGFKGRP